MKKVITLILASIMCFSLVACGNSGTTKGDNNNTTTKSTQDDIQYYKLGDTVSTDIFEFTLDAAEFTIALNNVVNDERFTPKEYDSQEDANNPYVAPVGHTYAAFTYTVNNLNRSSCEFHNGSFATVKYNGGEYSALTEGAYFLYEDQPYLDQNGRIRREEGKKWNSDPSMNFLLQVGKKETRRAYIDVPVEIKDLTEDVQITFKIPASDGKKEFTYLITKSDREAKKTKKQK